MANGTSGRLEHCADASAHKGEMQSAALGASPALGKAAGAAVDSKTQLLEQLTATQSAVRQLLADGGMTASDASDQEHGLSSFADTLQVWRQRVEDSASGQTQADINHVRFREANHHQQQQQAPPRDDPQLQRLLASVLLKQNQLDVLLMVNKRMEQEITAAKTALTNTMHGASELTAAKRVLKARNQQLQTRVDQLQAKFNAAQADCCAAQVLAAGLQRQLDAKGSCACGVLSQRSGVDTGDVCKSLSEEASFAAEGLDSKIQVELNAKNGCACIVLSPQRPAVSKRAQELCLDIEGIECDQDASEVPQAHPTSPKQRQPVGTLSTHGDGAHAASSTCDGLVAEAAFMQPEDSPIRDEI